MSGHFCPGSRTVSWCFLLRLWYHAAIGRMNPMDQQKIGTFLKQLRQERQLTQENLAEIMCVTNRSVSRWENGVNLPDLPTLIQLADF